MRSVTNEDGGAARRIEHITIGVSDVEAGAIQAALAFALAHGAFEEPQHKAQAVRAQKKVDEAMERAR